MMFMKYVYLLKKLLINDDILMTTRYSIVKTGMKQIGIVYWYNSVGYWVMFWSTIAACLEYKYLKIVIIS